MENVSLKENKGFALSYSETKWVSEKIVEIARSRGLLAAIYRPGDITGAANGIWNLEDMVSRMIVGIIQMGCVPRTSYCMHMTPVDFVSEAIAHISRKPECFGNAFHLINPQPMTIRHLVACLRACGYPVRFCTYIHWRSRLKKANTSDNSLSILECLIESESATNPGLIRNFTGRQATYDISNTALLLGTSGISCPPIGKKRIAAYLKNFARQGAIEPPRRNPHKI